MAIAAAMTLFAWWVTRQSKLKYEQKTKAWEVFVSLLTAVTTFVGGVLLISKYIDEQTKMSEDRIAQEQRELNQRKADRINVEAGRLQAKYDRIRPLYDAVKRVATDLASASPAAIAEVKEGDSRKRFEQLYRNELIGIEGHDVEGAMVRFRLKLVAWVESGQKPEDAERLALDLSRACEKELGQLDERIEKLRQQIAELTFRPVGR